MKIQKAALEFHLNSFASMHNAIRCDYFRSPADELLSDHLSIRAGGAALRLVAISQTFHLGSFLLDFLLLFFPLFKLRFAADECDSLRSTNTAEWRPHG